MEEKTLRFSGELAERHRRAANVEAERRRQRSGRQRTFSTVRVAGNEKYGTPGQHSIPHRRDATRSKVHDTAGLPASTAVHAAAAAADSAVLPAVYSAFLVAAAALDRATVTR